MNLTCFLFYLIPTTYLFLNFIQVRKLAYIRGNSAPRANLIILHKLLSARHELSEVSMPTYIPHPMVVNWI